jgi:ribosome maturation protein Sdo1
LEKGDLQVSEKERQMVTDLTMREIATQVASMAINTETNRPFPVKFIEKALDENHFDINVNQTAKQQVCCNNVRCTKSGCRFLFITRCGKQTIFCWRK